MIGSKNIYIRIASFICLIISVILLLELFVFPPKLSLEIFDHNYDYYTPSTGYSYYTKILYTTSNQKYILPDNFYYQVVAGDEIIIYKSFLFSWPLKLQIKNYIIPIGIFSDNSTKWILITSIILFVLIYITFLLFSRQIDRNDMLGKWLISIPLCLLIFMLYIGITQTYFI